MVNSQFAAFDERLCQCDWYKFSMKTQQIFGMFTTYAQESITIQGYGNTQCTRTSHGEVFRTRVSNYRNFVIQNKNSVINFCKHTLMCNVKFNDWRGGFARIWKIYHLILNRRELRTIFHMIYQSFWNIDILCLRISYIFFLKKNWTLKQKILDFE